MSISCDSIHSHNAFAEKLGGISFPMLSDFHPKGQMSSLYGVYNADRGTAVRAVFIVDTQGALRWRKLYPAGQGLPEVEELLAQLDQIG